jgi:hypothetical protein
MAVGGAMATAVATAGVTAAVARWEWPLSPSPVSVCMGVFVAACVVVHVGRLKSAVLPEQTTIIENNYYGGDDDGGGGDF